MIISYDNNKHLKPHNCGDNLRRISLGGSAIISVPIFCEVNLHQLRGGATSSERSSLPLVPTVVANFTS